MKRLGERWGHFRENCKYSYYYI
uniref:Uncharacterized protein n=1 Tax=Anguilla anguilla TaxID=7936 RepID=A0A0E9PFB7_ANGAN